ncbi:MAG TPA: SDR family NAD(P)-dependent oxidoreductase [Planctomycetes bacterium]|nr:SDR family NAD(P)-dependent oxidoreductase [Planctomycetota bacterium]HIK59690.1 SDR family NAD(P)-dependent oxidoreductase [Planctomycetota bacterium]
MSEPSAPSSTDDSGPGGAILGRALVVGASSGMGMELVRQLAGAGWAVGAVARSSDKLEALAAEVAGSAPATPSYPVGPVTIATCDVTQTDLADTAFAELVESLGGLDLMIFAAGIMPVVGREEYNTPKDLGILDTNLLGAVAWCNAAARLFASQRSGTLVGISSIAGARGRKGNPVYGASKAGLDHYLEALRNRLSEVGVHVCTIKPGFVETPMTAHLELAGAISAEEAARQILKAAKSRANTRYVPWRWALVAVVVKSIPSMIFKRLSI